MTVWKEEKRIPSLNTGRYAIRASKLISMAGEKPARGKELFRKLAILDNALLLVENGIISYIGPYKSNISQAYIKLDLGDAVIMPPLVNAHTHLQLSWLEGQCLFNEGFSSWLGDMIPKLLTLNANSSWTAEKRQEKLQSIIKNLKNCGTYFIGDVGGTIAGELASINKLAAEEDLEIQNFCEHFGFGALEPGEIWPSRCRKEIQLNLELEKKCAPCGHALYSTSIESLQAAKAWCNKNKRSFSMHLAESPEEEQALGEGKGGLIDLYYGKVIPEGWQPYGMRPYELAKKAGLVDDFSLFVHGVHLNETEIYDFAGSGAAICLCPRSNAKLGVGKAAVRSYIEKGARICLGTDGLTSNSDLNVLNELFFYREKEDLPFPCLLRMITVNALDALAVQDKAQLAKGAAARFSLMDLSLVSADLFME